MEDRTPPEKKSSLHCAVLFVGSLSLEVPVLLSLKHVSEFEGTEGVSTSPILILLGQCF